MKEGDNRQVNSQEMSQVLQCHDPWPNKGLELTASSVRLCLAPASNSSSCLALAVRLNCILHQSIAKAAFHVSAMMAAVCGGLVRYRSGNWRLTGWMDETG
jgi:hypothetical protein